MLQHHTDWLMSLLNGRRDTSDWNNTLKVGYDPQAQCYPAGLLSQVGLVTRTYWQLLVSQASVVCDRKKDFSCHMCVYASALSALTTIEHVSIYY